MVMTVQVTLAQGVGINTDGTAPDSSALLDIKGPASGNQLGMLIPRVSLATLPATTSFSGSSGPATYLQLVNTNASYTSPLNSFYNKGIGMYMNFGTPASPVWRRFLTSADSTLFWGLRGNIISAGDFIGSTNTSGTLPLEFKVNNITRLSIPTNAASGYITASNLVGFKAPVSSAPDIAVFSINTASYGLASDGSSYTTLRFGSNGYLKGVSGTGVGIGTTNPTPTEMLDVDGNIYSRNKFIYSESHVGAGQTKTGNVERYWSGYFPGSPAVATPSTSIFEESGTARIRFRLSKTGTDYVLEMSQDFTSSKNFVSNNNVYIVPSGSWGNWVPISGTFAGGTGNEYRFMVTRESATGGNNLEPLYRITIFFNGGHEYVRVLVEAYYSR